MQVAPIDFLGATCNHSAMDEDKFPSQLAERFQIRMPDGMRDALREAAEKNGRSMNTEIITRLEASLAAGGSGAATFDNIFENVISGIAGKPGAEKHLPRLIAEYEDYRTQQVFKLREFLHYVTAAAADMSGKPNPSLEEDLNRQNEMQFERMRSWANAWGYDFVKREDATADDRVEAGKLPEIDKRRKNSKKSA